MSVFICCTLNPDGTPRNEVKTGGATASSPALGVDGTIYLGINSNYCGLTPEGRQQWVHPTGGLIESSPALAADGVFYCASRDQILIAIGPDGKWRWGVYELGLITSSPVIAPDGTVYILSYDNKLNAFKASSPPAKSSWPMFRADAQHTGRVQVAP